MSVDFLLEIGTEEIPHWMIPDALRQLSTIELFGCAPTVEATPRRLVVRASNLPQVWGHNKEWVEGPPKSAGSVAAQKFAAKMGVTVDQLETRLRPKGEYFGFVKETEDNSILNLLVERLPSFILGLKWPKTMYWVGGKNGPRFIRPIRWLVALLGDEIIPFEVAGVKSGDCTRVHRLQSKNPVRVNIQSYDFQLKAGRVILSADVRRRKIVAEISALGAKADAELVETLTFITEYPTAIRGDFDPAYLELPAEVLTTVMRHHQKYFSVESATGKLAPHFVAVMNTSGDPEGLVKRGNERVLKARFNDARFFWDVDQQKKLVERVEDLAKVTFQAKLGSYLEKTNRVVALVTDLGGGPNARRAARLCKADLTTEMVKEFTDLQGQVGGLYARHQGEPEAVAQAIYDHYKPLSMEDKIPSTSDGQLVALADKLDTLRECFNVGLAPTGSKDPFALRRAAQGVIKILAVAQMQDKLSDLVSGELLDFMLDRVRFYFHDFLSFKYDEVNAVLAAGCGTVADVQSRLEALALVRPTPDFEPLAASFKRIRNILKQAQFVPAQGVDGALLESEAEHALLRQFGSVLSQLGPTKDYVARLEAIATLRPAVDEFFDKVLVNAKDEQVRNNRLTILYNLLTQFSTIADFSEIVTSGEKS